ncbi:uncharacterized protein LOC113312217 [Papaver somniferum]|uniref:uncharacterized protein LOC113312217 n=1 Tax=Papaver somniferum TaxID=3469 RepID=UPI000E6F7859|nr:uncharacterized protein LOC113312217 [Papaver somniferum]
MKKILEGLISKNQSAFISGRSIQDNIMVAHELVRNYHRSKGTPRCSLKIDISKAYDTVKWDAIFYILQQLGFPAIFINWIALCIKTTKFSILINGSPYGFFGAQRGLRQGCPISHYLFVLEMEMLSATLLKKLQLQKFGFHPRCKLTSLTHMCFADDVLIFFKGTTAAASTLKVALYEFSSYSGLVINNQKTSLFCSAVDDTTLLQITQILDCTVGEFPVKYLGVPLLSTKLSYKDCLLLLERRVIKELNTKFKRFLWAGPDLKKSYNPIKWSYACHAYEEGGLGIKDLEYTNVAANIRHIWDLVSGKDTIWTSWVKSNLIKDKYFWSMKIPQDPSWCWRIILDHRELAKKHIGVLLGNEVSTSFLYENWHLKGSLVYWVEPHILETIGANDNSKVVDFISTAGWVFPDFMEDDTKEVVKDISLTEFNLAEDDQIFWKSSATGNLSMKDTYYAITDHMPKPVWENLVWFKNHIPRHSFITWLVLLKILKTRSKLCKWGTISDSSCILCGVVEESEDHLLHECQFSSVIWKGLILKMGIIKSLESSWDAEINWCAQAFTGSNCVVMIKKLVLNNFVYRIWTKRNNRIFRALNGSQDQVSLLIIQDVRFKMLAMQRKENDTLSARDFMRRWNIDCTFVLPEIIFCTWLYPQNDEVMINTDGSKTVTAGGFGAIIRDHEAAVIGAASGEGPVSSEPKPPWKVLKIWRRIMVLKQKFARWRITFCYKEANQAVDYLAVLHLGNLWTEIRHEEFIADFREILAADKAQKVYQRKKKK